MSSRRIAVRAAAVVLAAAASAPAFGKAPPSVPTCEDVRQKAEQEEIRRKTAEAEKEKDPVREMCEAYAKKGGTKIDEWKPLSTVLLNAAETAEHRGMVARALIDRFKVEDAKNNADVRKVRRAVALEIGVLLGAKSSDDVGIACADQIFRDWYFQKLMAERWSVSASQRDRNKVWDSLKKSLKKDND